MAGRKQMSFSTAADGQDLHFTDAAIQNAQQTNGHIDFSFRKRLEKVDWRKIGMLETMFSIYITQIMLDCTK